MHAYSPGICEVAAEALKGQGQPGLHIKTHLKEKDRNRADTEVTHMKEM